MAVSVVFVVVWVIDCVCFYMYIIIAMSSGSRELKTTQYVNKNILSNTKIELSRYFSEIFANFR